MKRLAIESSIYGLGRAVAKFAGIFLVPIYTRFLTPSDYGIIDLIATSISIVSLLSILGLDSAMAFYYYQEEGSAEQKVTVSTSFTLRSLTACSLAGLLFLFSQRMSLLIFKTEAYTNFLRLAIVTFPLTLTVAFYRLLFRVKRAPWHFTALSLGSVLVTILLNIYLVVFWKIGVYGVLWSALVSQFLLTLVGFGMTRGEYGPSLRGARLGELLTYGIPLVPASISFWVLGFSDRYFLLRFAHLNEVGLYAVGVRVSSLLALVTTAFQMAWSPFAFSISHEKDAKRIYAKVLTYYVVLVSFLALGLSLFAKELLYIFTTSVYLEAYQVVGFLSFGLLAYGTYYVVSVGVSLTKKTVYIGRSVALSAFVNLALNYLLVPRHGMVGASIARLAAFSLCSFLVYKASQRFYFVDYEGGKIGLICGMGIALMMLGLLLDRILALSLPLTGIKGLLLAAFPAVVMVSGVFERREVALIKELLRKGLNGWSLKAR